MKLHKLQKEEVRKLKIYYSSIPLAGDKCGPSHGLFSSTMIMDWKIGIKKM